MKNTKILFLVLLLGALGYVGLKHVQDVRHERRQAAERARWALHVAEVDKLWANKEWQAERQAALNAQDTNRSAGTYTFSKGEIAADPLLRQLAETK